MRALKEGEEEYRKNKWLNAICEDCRRRRVRSGQGGRHQIAKFNVLIKLRIYVESFIYREKLLKIEYDIFF